MLTFKLLSGIDRRYNDCNILVREICWVLGKRDRAISRSGEEPDDVPEVSLREIRL